MRVLFRVRLTQDESERGELPAVVGDVPEDEDNPGHGVGADAVLVDVLQEEPGPAQEQQQERPVHHALEVVEAGGP